MRSRCCSHHRRGVLWSWEGWCWASIWGWWRCMLWRPVESGEKYWPCSSEAWGWGRRLRELVHIRRHFPHRNRWQCYQFVSWSGRRRCSSSCWLERRRPGGGWKQRSLLSEEAFSLWFLNYTIETQSKHLNQALSLLKQN